MARTTASERVRGGRACNQSLDLRGDGRATSGRAAREPGPVRAEAAPLPPQDGVGSHDHEGLFQGIPRLVVGGKVQQLKPQLAERTAVCAEGRVIVRVRRGWARVLGRSQP